MCRKRDRGRCLLGGVGGGGRPRPDLVLHRFPRANGDGVLNKVAREAGAVAVNASTAICVPGVAARLILWCVHSPEGGGALAGAPHRAAIVERLLQRKVVLQREKADRALGPQSEDLLAHDGVARRGRREREGRRGGGWRRAEWQGRGSARGSADRCLAIRAPILSASPHSESQRAQSRQDARAATEIGQTSGARAARFQICGGGHWRPEAGARSATHPLSLRAVIARKYLHEPSFGCTAALPGI